MPPDPARPNSPAPELPPLEGIHHVHLIAAAGTGMGTLACMLAERGYRVTGSDRAAYPPMSDQLVTAGVSVAKGFHPDHVLLEPADLVVIGNAVRPDNPEARAAIDAGIPFVSFPDAVSHFFVRDRRSLVITGTHGKTTSTSLVSWILTHARRDPTVLIGGVARNLGRGFRIGEGEHFVVEGDEYDTAFFDKTPKFLHYGAHSVLFTSCEFDHADIYESLDDVASAFRSLMRVVPADGRVVACADSRSVTALLTETRAEVVTYGFDELAAWKVSDVAFDAEGTQFNVWFGDDRLGRVRIPLFGRHNVENALGAIALCHAEGVGVPEAAAALARFEGVRRRQELRGEAAGLVVIDDFAHHPTAVRGTIEAVRARYPDRRLFAIFEPRTNTSRRRFFEDAYVDALDAADSVLIADVFQKDAIPEGERFRPERVVEALVARGVEAAFVPDAEALIERVASRQGGHDVALVMSNGDFEGVWERLLARLRRDPSQTGAG